MSRLCLLLRLDLKHLRRRVDLANSIRKLCLISVHQRFNRRRFLRECLNLGRLVALLIWFKTF